MWVLVIVLVIACIIQRHFQWYRNRTKKRSFPVPTMVILGSGGHTREMMSLAQSLIPMLYSPRIYVSSMSDKLSDIKAIMLEESRDASDYSCWRVYRAREVAQSWSTTCLTTIISLIHSIFIIFYHRPDLILCNGPGVCVPLCTVAFLAKVFGLFRVKILYVESVCRLQSISMSGKIMRFMADEFLVQWRHMAVQYPFSKYIGRIS